MKNQIVLAPAIEATRRSARTLCAVTAILLVAVVPSALKGAEPGKTFVTPAEAVKALAEAVNTTNRVEFAALFGSESERLANEDTVQGARDLAEFKNAFNETNRLVKESETRMTLEVGTNNWPFPIPLVKTNGGWHFDGAAGIEEILDRRIGRNELNTLRVMRAYVAAQREYASQDRDGDGVLKYAQKLASSPGKTDGLYWPPTGNGEDSPLGPLVAEAQGEGYFAEDSTKGAEPRPYHGYFFKVLTRQGKHTPGGRYNFIINGNMIGGFALVAWPAEYDESGVMTFIVNQQGRVYQKDLGPKTAAIVRKMHEYDCDPTWRLSPD